MKTAYLCLLFLSCCISLAGCATRRNDRQIIGVYALQAYMTVLKHSDSSIGIVYGGRDPVIAEGKILSPESVERLSGYEIKRDSESVTYEISSVGYGVEGVNWYNWGATLEVDQRTRTITSFTEWRTYSTVH